MIVVTCAFALSACDNDTASPSGADRTDSCGGFNSFLDLAEAGPLEPRDWGKMMLAAARLGYSTNDCGERVVAPQEELCADLRAAIDVFRSNEYVPQGDNRESAIRISSQEYRAGRCQPPLSPG